MPESPKALVLDGGIAAAGFAFALKLLPLVTGILAAVLLVFRIRVAVIEYRIKKRELGE